MAVCMRGDLMIGRRRGWDFLEARGRGWKGGKQSGLWGCVMNISNLCLLSALPYVQRLRLLLPLSSDLSIPVLRLDIVGHRLRFCVAVVWVVRVVRWSNVFHLVHTATLIASLVGAVARDLPQSVPHISQSSYPQKCCNSPHTNARHGSPPDSPCNPPAALRQPT